MKLEKTKFFLVLIAIVTDGGSPPDDENARIADGDVLDARARERLRPIFPEQYPLH
jgi:hypothetical protein